MKRIMVIAALLVGIGAWAQQGDTKKPGQTPTTPGQTSATSGPGGAQGSAQGQAGQTGQAGAAQGQAGQPAAAPAKRPPQAKSQEEFKAFNDANALNDPAALEKAADEFSAKFPASELRVLLYRKAMMVYQNANNGDKMMAMGRKVLGVDPDDPQALIGVAEVESETTRPTDLDSQEKLNDAMKLAQHSLQTVETDLMFGPNVPPDRVKQAKDWLRSTAYSVIGNIDMAKNDYPAAERDLKKAIEMNQEQPDPVNYLRLAVALDKQNKYPEALQIINKAVQLAPENTQAGTLARREQDRLKQLTGGSANPSSSAGPAPNSPQPQPVTPQQH